MALDMRPQRGDYMINLPMTLDYKGGRQENSKNKIIGTIVVVVLTLGLTIALFFNQNLEVWQRCVYALVAFYGGVLIERYMVLNEFYFSDVYELMLRTDFVIPTDSIWQIFDIEYRYPYICYFKNGRKGLFVKMEKDAITGKPEDAIFDHYDAISEAYNLTHSLNMDMVHIDYMDNVGNDVRLKKLFTELSDIKNVDMQDMMSDIYLCLENEMSRNYACYDIYLYLSKDLSSNLVYNVQNVSNLMLGGNFITYKIMDRAEINTLCKAIFNIYDFSIVDACAEILNGEINSGIIPISVRHGDGTVDELNKTVSDQQFEYQNMMRKRQEAELEKRNKRHENRRAERKKPVKARSKKKVQESMDTDIDLFSDSNDDDFNLF